MRDKRKTIAFVFLDGVGIGPDDASVNPFIAANLPALSSMFGNVIPSSGNSSVVRERFALIPLDANLDVEGLPQSGTGQTALFTGINAAAHIGKHFGPYPYSTLLPVIEENNFFRRIHESGKQFYFANAYPKQFFDYAKKYKRRLTVTTLACILSGLPLHTADDLRAGIAISADITNERWGELGYPDIVPIPEAEAGRRFAGLASKHDFVLFEYFLTDHAGHKQDMSNAVRILERLDGFLHGFRDAMDESTLLVMTSDHGNIEDLRTRTHTRNKVPLWVYGEDSAQFIQGLTSITDLASQILRRLHVA